MQTMKMKLAQSLAALAVVFTGSAFAKTVAWYHFDEGAPGTYATTSMEILNALDETTLIGTPGTRGTGVTDDFLPKFVDEFATYTYLVDPVAGTTNANHRSLAFKRADNASGQVNRLGGSVAVAADATLSLSTLTVEFFVRPDDASGGMQWVAKRNGSNTGHFTYSICLNAGKPYVNVYSLVEGQMTLDPSTGASKFAYSKSIADGTWHHVALTVDPSADADHPTAKLYVDYVLRATVTLANPLCNVDSGANGTLYLGMSTMGYYAPSGSLDEVRISDTVLMPEQFLRWENVQTSDAAVRLSLDNAYDYTVSSGAVYNVATGTELLNEVKDPKFTVKALHHKTYWVVPEASSDKPFDLFRRGYFSEATAEVDAGTMTFGTTFASDGTTKRQGFAFAVPAEEAETLLASSFTFQAMLKLDEKPVTETGLLRQKYTTEGGSSVYGVFASVSSVGEIGISGMSDGKSKSQSVTGANVCDGKWHHVAVVYDLELKKLSLYLDKVCQGSLDDYVIGTQSSTDLAILGTDWAALPCMADEIVIDQRALEPSEFVTGSWSTDNTRLSVDFDENAVMQPGGGEATVTAVYSPAVPGDYVHQSEGEVARANTRSLHFDGTANTAVKFPHTKVIELASMTVEFFVRYEKAEAWAGLLRCCQADRNYTTTPIWSVGFNGDASAVIMRVDTSVKGNQSHDFGNSFMDGRWHHVAVTFEPTQEGNTLIRMYDTTYKGVSTQVGGDWTVQGALNYANGSCLGVGISSMTRYFTGNIDELRISKGVLAPSQFLKWSKKPRGMALLYR